MMTWFHWSTNQFWWSLAHIEHFCFCLNISNGLNRYPVVISELMESLECCQSRNSNTSIISSFGNFTTFRKSIENKDPAQLTFIFSCCLGFATVVRSIWTSSSGYLWDYRLRESHLERYLLLRFVSFPQRMNDGFLCLWHILYFLSFMILGDRYLL